jgi:hypothetical protein
MKTHILLLAGAMAWVACESATEPTAVDPSARETVQFDAAAGPISDGLVLREFTLKSEGEFVRLGWCDEAAGLAYSAAPGEGTMTHVGRFELQQAGCVNLATGVVTDGQGILTAANGDQIHLAYAGSAVNLDPLTYELHYVTTGGTGRFSRAEGESDFVVVYTSETTWIAEGGGWIRYAASDRADR